MKKQEEFDFNPITEGKLFPALLKFSLPLIFALLLQALYGAVDLIVVGQLGTPSSVSAVSMGGQFMHTVTVIIAGITMGGTVVIGNYFGAKDYKATAKSIGNLFFICAIMTCILTALVVGLARQFTDLLNVPEQARERCTQYIMVCGAGTVFIVGYNFLSAVFRGIGNSKIPFLFIAISCVVNILLDILLVGTFKMDALGAAVATVAAQGISVLLSIVYVFVKKLGFKVEKADFKPSVKYLTRVMRIGTPIALQDSLTSISFLLISSFINVLGVVQSASVGIGERLFLFLIIVPMSFMSAISTFVAQNQGAGNIKRANKSLIYGLILSCFFGIGMFFLTHFGGEMLSKLFTQDIAVIAMSAEYLKGCSYEYLITCVTFCLVGYFNGRSKTLFTMAQGLTVAFAARVPLAFFFTKIPNITMYEIGLAVPYSALVTLVLCVLYMAFLMIKDKKQGVNAINCRDVYIYECNN